MSVVRVRLAEVASLPAVCVVTGQPTDQRVPVRFTTSRWRWFSGATIPRRAPTTDTPVVRGRSATVPLPVSAGAVARHRRLDLLFRGSSLLAAVVLIWIVAANTGGAYSATPYGYGFLVGLVQLLLLSYTRRSLPRGEVDAEGVLILSDVHPEFRTAVDRGGRTT